VNARKPRTEVTRVCGVIMHTERTDTEVAFSVHVVLDEVAYETGDNERGVWNWIVVFGATDATVSGGARFVEAARCQQRIADEVWAQRHDRQWNPLDNPWQTVQP
jgi:hypothetical protein